MTQQTIIRSACYLCEGTIEFPAELANQIIPCPHCGKEIKLFAASKSSSRIGGLFAGRAWNVKQTAVVVLAVVGLLVSLFNAPWEITYRDSYNSPTKAEIVLGSVFQPPTTWHSDVTGHRLLAMPLAFGWCGIAAVTGFLLFLLRTRDVPLVSAQTQVRLRKDAQAVLKVVAMIAGAVAIVAVVAATILIARGFLKERRDLLEQESMRQQNLMTARESFLLQNTLSSTNPTPAVFTNIWGDKAVDDIFRRYAVVTRKELVRRDTNAETKLAYDYAKGNGVRRDGAKANKLWRDAADKGDAVAQANVGLSFWFGDGERQNYPEATFWFAEAAVQGHPGAQYFLAEAYRDKKGVNSDAAESYKWLFLSAIHDFKGAPLIFGHEPIPANQLLVEWEGPLLNFRNAGHIRAFNFAHYVANSFSIDEFLGPDSAAKKHSNINPLDDLILPQTETNSRR